MTIHDVDDGGAQSGSAATDQVPVAPPVTDMRVRSPKPPPLRVGPPQAMPTSAGGSELLAGLSGRPERLPRNWDAFQGEDGHTYCRQKGPSNDPVLRVGSPAMNAVLRAAAAGRDISLRGAGLDEINDRIRAFAEQAGVRRPVWYRVAPIPNGVEIDLCDEVNTRVRITPGTVEIVARGSETLFRRTPVSRPMAKPAEVGNRRLLAKYLNVHVTAVPLLVGWLSYVLAHPKVPTNKFPILVLQGGQGSGKTSLTTNVILPLTDPNAVGVQILPNTPRDLAIAAQNAHVLAYDNVRSFKPAMSDVLCIAATGGAISHRQLYTDADQHVVRLHVALILNGLHMFVTQGDLAQRCLPIQLERLPEAKRRTEAELRNAFEADLPAIQRGLFDLIARIFEYLPTAEVTNPERMIDFVRWLAAMEVVDRVPPGVYQAEYSHVLKEGQYDTLMGNVLAAAVLAFVERSVDDWWTGTPSELYEALADAVDHSTARSREWPSNPIAMSKRLRGLQASLLSQGVSVEFGRGKLREITIEKKGDLK